MKISVFFPSLAARLALLLPLATAQAATLYWDADGPLPPDPEDPLFGTVVDGDGVWNRDPLNPSWTTDNGLTNVEWTSTTTTEVPDDAVFGAGQLLNPVITINNVSPPEELTPHPVAVRNITFAPLGDELLGYTITSGTLTLTSTPARSVITTDQMARISAQLAGSGFVKEGPATLTMAAAAGSQWSDQLSTITVNAGTLELEANNNKHLIHRGTLSIASGATLRLIKPNVIIDDNSVIDIAAGGTFDLNDQAEKFGYLSGSGTFLPGEANWAQQLGAGGRTFTYSGDIGGTGTVTLDAPNTKSYGTQVFAGTNTFTGTLAVAAGTLAFANPAALGASIVPDIAIGNSRDTYPVYGILRYTGDTALTFSRPLFLAGLDSSGVNTSGTVLGGGGIESSGSAPVTVSSPITSAEGGKSLVLGGSNAGANTLTSVLSNSPGGFPIGLLKTGSGTWHLRGANSFTGPVEMNDGELHLDSATALGVQSSLLLHGGTVFLRSGDLSLGDAASGSGLSGAGGTVDNAAAGPATLTVRTGFFPQTFRGTLTNSGGALSLVKAGSGALSLMGAAHSYSGSTTVSAGTLRLSPAPAALPVAGPVWNLDASDAASVTAVEGVVSKWSDKSGTFRHVIPDANGTAPAYVENAQNGLAAIRFNGVTDKLSLDPFLGIAADAQSVFIVCTNTDNAENGGIIGGDGTTGSTAERGIRGVRAGTWYGAGDNIDFATPKGSEFRVNGALTSEVKPDGGSWHVLSALRGGGSGMQLNCVGGFTAPNAGPLKHYSFKGDIGQVIVYGRVLSADERNKTEAWLRQKWFGGAASANLLPVTTPVTVAAAATLDAGVPQTVASLDLSGSLRMGLPAGEFITSGATTLHGGSTLYWDVTDWTGPAGTGSDVLTAGTLTIDAAPGTPVKVRISAAALANFSPASRDFTLARTTGGITGFDAANFTLDTAAFTSGTGVWSIAQNGNDLVLHYEGTTLTAYDQWIAQFPALTGPDAAATADPDGDGFANALEFAVHGDPSDPDRSLALTPVAAGDHLTVSIPVLGGAAFAGQPTPAATVEGVTVTVEASADLATWTVAAEEVIPALTDGLAALPEGWTWHSFRIADPLSGGARGYLRVRLATAP